MESEWSEYFVDEIEFGESYTTFEKIIRAPKVIYSFEAIKKLGKLLSKIKPDICHAHNIYHHISPSVLSVLKHKNIPVVITLHDLKLACPAYNMLAPDGICERCNAGRLYNVVVHKCIKNSLALSGMVMLESALHSLIGSYKNNVTRFVVPSHFYIEKLVSWGWRRERFTHIPNFIDVHAYTPGKIAGRPFLFFGRLSKEKGLETLITAAKIAQVPLLIAGEGPSKEKLMKMVDPSSQDVRFLGYLTGQGLHEAIRSARATVLPSEWYENAPISVMESYALGKPVIGASIGGIPELVKNHETGLTFESGSVESLVVALRRMADMSDSRILEMGISGRSWMEQEFSVSVYRERIMNLYKEIGAI